MSCTNHRADPRGYLAADARDDLGEIHLLGYAREELPGGPFLIDAHGTPVADAVWTVWAEVVARTGPLAVLIAWDNDMLPFAVLLAEADRARALLAGLRQAA